MEVSVNDGIEQFAAKKKGTGDFPEGPVVGSLPWECWGLKFDP